MRRNTIARRVVSVRDCLRRRCRRSRPWNGRCARSGGIAEDERAEGSSSGPRTKRRRESCYARDSQPCSSPSSSPQSPERRSPAPQPRVGADTAEKAAKLSETFSVLHAVSQWSINLSEMADKRAKSDLVKNYARDDGDRQYECGRQAHAPSPRTMGSTSAPLDPQTEEGKSLLDRMKAETALLGSLEGDAFDKEYMTLVTNTQQSVIHFLETTKASAKDPEVKQFLGDMTTTVQNRLKTAQDIMAKVYGDEV